MKRNSLMFIMIFLGFIQVFSQNQESLYEEAKELYQNEEYCNSLKILNGYELFDFEDAKPLRKLVEKKIESLGLICIGTDPVPSPVQTDEELLQEAQDLASDTENLDKQEEALMILEGIRNIPVKMHISKVKENIIKIEKQQKEITAIAAKKKQKAIDDKKLDALKKEKKLADYKNLQDSLARKDSISRIDNEIDNSTIDDVGKVVIEKEDYTYLYLTALGAIVFIALLIGITAVMLSKRRGQSSGQRITISVDNTGQILNFNKSRISIGRDRNNDIRLPEKAVSKFHAEILFNDSTKQYTIRDLNSLNGIYVNDRKSSQATIYPGDRIKVCNYHLRIS